MSNVAISDAKWFGGGFIYGAPAPSPTVLSQQYIPPVNPVTGAPSVIQLGGSVSSYNGNTPSPTGAESSAQLNFFNNPVPGNVLVLIALGNDALGITPPVGFTQIFSQSAASTYASVWTYTVQIGDGKMWSVNLPISPNYQTYYILAEMTPFASPIFSIAPAISVSGTVSDRTVTSPGAGSLAFAATVFNLVRLYTNSTSDTPKEIISVDSPAFYSVSGFAAEHTALAGNGLGGYMYGSGYPVDSANIVSEWEYADATGVVNLLCIFPAPSYVPGHYVPLYTIPGTSAASFPTIQEANVDFSDTVKELRGVYEDAEDLANASRKISGKIVTGRISITQLNSFVFGQLGGENFHAATTGTVSNEAHTIPGSPFEVTVAYNTQFLEDLGVTYFGAHDQLIPVSTVTQAGQYSVASGVYTFYSSDAAAGVLISYRYTISSGHTLEVDSELMGNSRPTFSALFTNPDDGDQELLVTNCKATKVSVAIKTEDYVHLEMDFTASANDEGVSFQWLSSY